MTELVDRVRAVLGDVPQVEGWATVDLERASEAVVTLGGHVAAAPGDELLGARAAIARQAGGAEDVVLLEPSTEGRLAATLARHDEGLAVHYLLVGADAATRLHAAEVPLSAEAEVPLGRGRLVVGGSRWGPHVVLVVAEEAPGQEGLDGSPATIGR